MPQFGYIMSRRLHKGFFLNAFGSLGGGGGFREKAISCSLKNTEIRGLLHGAANLVAKSPIYESHYKYS